MLFVIFFFVLSELESLSGAFCQFENYESQHSEYKQIGRIADEEDGEVDNAVTESFQSMVEGGLDPLQEGGFFHRGVFLYISEVQEYTPVEEPTGVYSCTSLM